MTSQDDFDRYVESQRNVRSLILRDLAAWWATATSMEPESLREAASEFLPLLARAYGEVSATLAADFYEAAREDSGARGRFTAELAENRAGEQAARSARWATAPLARRDVDGLTDAEVDALSDEDLEAAYDRMASVADAAALQAGRDTLMFNTKRDPANPRFARIPVGDTCAWCLMLGSRGAIYRSAESAGAAKDYHFKCDCQPTPSWNRGEDLPSSYDEGELYELYARARDEAGSSDPKAIAAAIRRLDGGVHVDDGVTSQSS